MDSFLIWVFGCFIIMVLVNMCLTIKEEKTALNMRIGKLQCLYEDIRDKHVVCFYCNKMGHITDMIKIKNGDDPMRILCGFFYVHQECFMKSTGKVPCTCGCGKFVEKKGVSKCKT